MITKEEGLQSVRDRYTNIHSIFRLHDQPPLPHCQAWGWVWQRENLAVGVAIMKRMLRRWVAEPYFCPTMPSQSEESMPVKS